MKKNGVHYICLTKRQVNKLSKGKGITVVLLNQRIAIDVERGE